MHGEAVSAADPVAAGTPPDGAEFVGENPPLPVNPFVNVDTDHLSGDDLAGPGVFPVGEPVPVEALEVDQALRHPFGPDTLGVDGGETGVDELVLAVGQFGGRQVDPFGDGFADNVDDKFFFSQDIAGGVLGLAGGGSDQGGESHNHGLGADTGEEAEGGQVVATALIAGRNQGDGAG